jgi:hypothetical protein
MKVKRESMARRVTMTVSIQRDVHSSYNFIVDARNLPKWGRIHSVEELQNG